ncbi:MAG: hypothetical protein MUD01_27105 [Chloroflexaceae bacterium]|nr:hypothetical protein [Chloroflexaceae bacterium]
MHRTKLLLLPLLVLVAGAGLWLLRPESSRREQRLAAEARWETQQLGNYRIALELTRQDERCFQEFDVSLMCAKAR